MSKLNPKFAINLFLELPSLKNTDWLITIFKNTD